MQTSNLNKVKKEDCAVIVIDMQNDFVSEGAPIECAGAREIIPTISNFLDFIRSQKVPIIYTQETHREQKVDFGIELERSPQHCIKGSMGYEIVKELTPQKADFIIRKPRFSSFYATDLDILLKGLDKKILLITGVATNVCVYATAMDAMQRDYRVVVVSDCVAGSELALHNAFLKNIQYILGDVVKSKDIIETFS